MACGVVDTVEAYVHWLPQTEKLPAGRKNWLRIACYSFQVCIFDGDSSWKEMLMSKVLFVTFDESNKARARKPRSMPISGANMTDKRKGKIAYGENDKCNDRKRFCEP